MNQDLKSRLIRIFSPLILDEEMRDRLSVNIELMWDDCIDKGAFGYSAHYEALVGKLPRLYEKLLSLISNEQEINLVLNKTSAILKWLPYDSEETHMGYTHNIHMYKFNELVESSSSLTDLLQNFDD